MKQLYKAQFVLIVSTSIGLIMLVISGWDDDSTSREKEWESRLVVQTEKEKQDSEETAQQEKPLLAVGVQEKQITEPTISPQKQINRKSISHYYFTAQGDVQRARQLADAGRESPKLTRIDNDIVEEAELPPESTPFIKSPQKIVKTVQLPAPENDTFSPFEDDKKVVANKVSLTTPLKNNQPEIEDIDLVDQPGRNENLPEHRHYSNKDQHSTLQKEFAYWKQLKSQQAEEEPAVAESEPQQHIQRKYTREKKLSSDSPLRYSGKPSRAEYRLDSIWYNLSQLANAPDTNYQLELQETLDQLRKLQTNMRINDLESQLEDLRESVSDQNLKRNALNRSLSRRYRGQRYYFIGRSTESTHETSVEKAE